MDYFHSLISKLLWSRALDSNEKFKFGCLSFLALAIGFAGKVLFAPTYLGHSVLPNEANGPVFATEEENPQVDLTLRFGQPEQAQEPAQAQAQQQELPKPFLLLSDESAVLISLLPFFFILVSA